MATIQVLIDAKVANLAEVGALDAEVNKLSSSTSNLGGSLDKTTGSLNVAGAAHGAAAKEAATLGADVEKAATQVNVAGEAHVKAASATSALGTQMGAAATQAKTYGAEAENLGAKLSTLQGPSGLAGVEQAAASTTSALQGLAVVDAQAASAASSSSSAMQGSSTALADLAVVDGKLATSKKATTAAIVEQAAAMEKSKAAVAAEAAELGLSVSTYQKAKSAVEQSLAAEVANSGAVQQASASLEKAKAAHEAHTEAVLKGVKATGEFGEAGIKASEKMSALSGILGGAGGVSLGLAGFVVGVGAAVAIAKSGIESFTSFGEEVLKFQRITGATAETSSRLIDVFGQFGVGADVADKAMFQLAHRTQDVGGSVAKTEQSLADLGVQVVKNKDGSTDLEKTLFNVAGAYQAAGSAADKNAIAYAAFGKSAQQLIPVLEQGSLGLQQMSDNAARVFTQQQLEQVHQYNVAMAQSGQQIDSLKDKIGGAIVPALGAMAQAVNDSAAANAYADATLKAEGRTEEDTGISRRVLAAQGQHLAEQQRKNAEASKEEAEAAKRLSEQLADEEQARQDLLDQDNRSVQANFGLERSALAVTSAQHALADETLKDTEYAHKHQASVDAISTAQAKYNAAVTAYGPASAQAKAAQDVLNKAIDAGKTLDQQNAEAADRLSESQLRVKEAMLQDSLAAVAAAEKNADLAGGHLSARDAAAAQATELQKLKDQAGGVLPAELQALLDKLNAFVDHTATLHLRLDDQTGGMRGSFGTQIVSAEGGIFTRPTLTWVGESGPEAVVPLRAGNTMPGASPLAGRSSGTQTAGMSMDDTNELLAEQNQLLAAIKAQLSGPAFATRAYGA